MIDSAVLMVTEFCSHSSKVMALVALYYVSQGGYQGDSDKNSKPMRGKATKETKITVNKVIAAPSADVSSATKL